MVYHTFGARSTTTAAQSAATTTTLVAVKPVKAKCPANQHLIDRLLEKRSKVQNSHYGHTLRKATDSLSKHDMPVTSFKEAKQLKGIGDHVANLLFPPSKNAVPPSPASSTASSKQQKKRKRPPKLGGSSMSSIPEQQEEQQQQQHSAHQQQLAHDAAVQETNSCNLASFIWKVVLLIDIRERESDHMIAKCQMSGIPCEERSLPIGDMAWIAQGMPKNKSTKKNDDNVQIELMVGTIIERKTTDDLKASLFGTRYNEQQLRLRHSGLPQVLFLIEGDVTKDLSKCPAETIHSTLHEIRLKRKFSIVQTMHMDDTVRTLKAMHRRILQRTFPETFRSQEALPDFNETYSKRFLCSCNWKINLKSPLTTTVIENSPTEENLILNPTAK